MKQLVISVIALCSLGSASAETFTAHYFGSEIDLNQKYNPCKGRTDGGVEVIVVTNINEVQNTHNRTVVERTYSLPDGVVIKKDRKVIDEPKEIVLHKLFPREFPKVKS